MLELEAIVARRGGHVKSTARDILAAGYRKPRTITTAEELDALPDWSVIGAGGTVFVRSREGKVCWATLSSGFAGSSVWIIRVHVSATVLWEPQP